MWKIRFLNACSHCIHFLSLFLHYKGSIFIYEEEYLHNFEMIPGTKSWFWYRSDFTVLSYFKNMYFSYCKKEISKEIYCGRDNL